MYYLILTTDCLQQGGQTLNRLFDFLFDTADLEQTFKVTQGH